MQQLDRRRALLWKPAGQASEWDAEYYASSGELPSERYFTTTIAQNSSMVINGDYLRITAKTGGANRIIVKPALISQNSEVEYAFYIRQWNNNNASDGGISFYSGDGSSKSIRIDMKNAYAARTDNWVTIYLWGKGTPTLNTRYVAKIVSDYVNGTGKVYVNDTLIYTYSNNFLSASYSCMFEVFSASATYTAIADLEYIRYKNL